MPERKVYLSDSKGRPAADIWDDVKALTGQNAERTGYPTQKPLALLERIIAASSNPGDMILDPFCGCATAFVAADRLQREWAGIDLSELAITLVNERIAEDRAATKEAEHNPVIGGSLFRATALTAPPVSTDLGDLPNYRTPLRRAGRRLRGLPEAFPVPGDGRGSHPAAITQRDRSPGQPAIAVLRLQPEQGQQDDGRMESDAMTILGAITGLLGKFLSCLSLNFHL